MSYGATVIGYSSVINVTPNLIPMVNSGKFSASFHLCLGVPIRVRIIMTVIVKFSRVILMYSQHNIAECTGHTAKSLNDAGTALGLSRAP